MEGHRDGDTSSPSLDFQILGPIDVRSGSHRVDIGGPRQRAVLAMLLLSADRVVPVDRLVEAVWGGRPPTTSRTQVAICVARLRKAFRSVGAGDVIATIAPGYLLHSAGHRIDAVLFADQVERAQIAAQLRQTADAIALFRKALGLWRGSALAGVSSYLTESEATRLEELRLGAVEQYAALQLERGWHQQVVAALTPVVRDQPLREHARATLMLAHYRSGLRAESLELFRQARRLFVDELGLEPGRMLQDLHSAILREDQSLTPADLLGGAETVS